MPDRGTTLLALATSQNWPKRPGATREPEPVARADTPNGPHLKRNANQVLLYQTYARYLFDILLIIFVIKTRLNPNRATFGSHPREPHPA
jgi:hypothetical protein